MHSSGAVSKCQDSDPSICFCIYDSEDLRVITSPSYNELQERNDELLSKQFLLVTHALSDPAPAVRVEAAVGICTLLDRYWELIPHGTVATYLQRLSGRVSATLRAGLRMMLW